MKLQEIQQKFQDHIVRTDKAIETGFSDLCETGKIPLEARMKVYRDNVIGGLAATLSKTYPTVEALCGEEFTQALMKQFVRENLPQSGCLDEYGQEIPSFIERLPQEQKLPYLFDIACFDWFMSVCEHAVDDKAMRPEALQQIADMDAVRLSLRTSACLLCSDYPLIAIREFALDPDNDKKEAPSLEGGPDYILIYRPYLKAEYVRLSSAEFVILSHLQKGALLQQALEETLMAYPDFDLAGFLHKCFKLEVFKH